MKELSKSILRWMLLILFCRSDTIKRRNDLFLINQQRKKTNMATYYPSMDIPVFNLGRDVIQPGLDWIVSEKEATVWREYCIRGIRPQDNETGVFFGIYNLIMKYHDCDDRDTIAKGWSYHDIVIFRQRLLSTMVNTQSAVYDVSKNYSLTALLLSCISTVPHLNGDYIMKDFYIKNIGTGYTDIQEQFIDWVRSTIMIATLQTKPDELPYLEV